MSPISAPTPDTAIPAAVADRCPVCRSKILVAEADHVMVRNAILRVDVPTRRVSAKCARCKTWVEVPLRYSG